MKSKWANSEQRIQIVTYNFNSIRNISYHYSQNKYTKMESMWIYLTDPPLIFKEVQQLQNLFFSFSQFPPCISLSLHGARDPVPNNLLMHLPKFSMIGYVISLSGSSLCVPTVEICVYSTNTKWAIKAQPDVFDYIILI